MLKNNPLRGADMKINQFELTMWGVNYFVAAVITSFFVRWLMGRETEDDYPLAKALMLCFIYYFAFMFFGAFLVWVMKASQFGFWKWALTKKFGLIAAFGITNVWQFILVCIVSFLLLELLVKGFYSITWEKANKNSIWIFLFTLVYILIIRGIWG
jgi:hypothetical protein